MLVYYITSRNRTTDIKPLPNSRGTLQSRLFLSQSPPILSLLLLLLPTSCYRHQHHHNIYREIFCCPLEFVCERAKEEKRRVEGTWRWIDGMVKGPFLLMSRRRRKDISTCGRSTPQCAPTRMRRPWSLLSLAWSARARRSSTPQPGSRRWTNKGLNWRALILGRNKPSRSQKSKVWA